MIRTHPPEKCKGQFCCLHNPSNHHMVNWKRVIRETGLVERLCSCGIGHPDPDSLAYFESFGLKGFDVHACCGHCRKPCKCTYCGKRVEDSEWKNCDEPPFFEARPSQPEDNYYCGCWGWD